MDHRPGSHDDLENAVAGVTALIASETAAAPGLLFYNEALGRYVDVLQEKAPWWCGPGVETFE